jgi:hypothetical protein
MSNDFKAALAGVVIMASGLLSASASLGDEPASAPAGKKLKAGLSPTVQLLQLMDTDKNGKVSKEEFMRFMEAEFDLADTDKNGELDPQELRRFVYRVSHPGNGPER